MHALSNLRILDSLSVKAKDQAEFESPCSTGFVMSDITATPKVLVCPDIKIL